MGAASPPTMRHDALGVFVKPLRVSVIVPTYNRPDSLANALRSIAGQNRKPDEVIVVDDGESDVASLESHLLGTGIRFLHVRKDLRGLCRSRNFGIRASAGDIIVFIDDDIVMDPGYLAGFLDVFESDPAHHIGGLSGRIRRYKNGVLLPEDHEESWDQRLGRLFFLSPKAGGRVTLAGFRKSCLWPTGRVPVEFLQGGNMALRREVFLEHSFDEDLDRDSGGYSLGEDVHFSYPLRLRWKMLSIESASCEHRHEGGGRPDAYKMAKMRVLHTWQFLQQCVDMKPIHYVAFAWAILGLCIVSFLSFVARPRSATWARLRGTIGGGVHVIRHSGAAPRPVRGGVLQGDDGR